jgi:hypothetical protein
MSDEWGRDAMEAWASARGLTFEGEGLFPAATPFLRYGLGAGEHRASVVVSQRGGWTTSVGGLSKKPERHTMNVTRGQLPGGLVGVVGHHFHLEYDTSGEDDNWQAVPHTVVLGYVQEGARVCRELHWRGDMWVTDPPEPQQDLDALTDGVAELAGPWEGLVIEMRDGAICVAAPGVIETDAHLDHLCRIASALADGARRAAALHPPLDATAPTRAQVLPPDLAWVEPLTQQIQWTGPPASVPEAMAAYAGLHGERHKDTHRKVSLIALVVLLLGGLIWFGFDVALALVFDMPFEALVVAIVGICGIPVAVRAAWRAGKETADDDVAARSRLPGLEAFAREYARSRGMALEDRDEFRRRFASPIPGAPLKVMYGTLGGEVTGRVVMWMARDERWEMRYWNMAVVPAPEGEAAGVLPQFRVDRVDNMLVITEPVPDEGRSVERLDALRTTAVRAAGGTPALAQ